MQTLKEKLEAYNAAALEMKLIEEELSRFHRVRDSVKGSMTEHPYILRTIPVTGVDLNVAGMLEARRDKLARLRADVEQFLAVVDDPYMVTLLRLRFIKGLSWQAVAHQAPGYNTDECVKKMVYRFLEKSEGCPECPESPC